MRTCPQCGGRLARSRTEQAHVVAGCRFLVAAPAVACKECRATFVPGRTLERVELEIACVLATRAPPSGEGLRYMRHVLGMRAADLASLLNVTAETMSRWENDQRVVDTNAWVCAGSLLLEHAGRAPRTRERLVALKASPALPETHRIDLPARA